MPDKQALLLAIKIKLSQEKKKENLTENSSRYPSPICIQCKGQTFLVSLPSPNTHFFFCTKVI